MLKSLPPSTQCTPSLGSLIAVIVGEREQDRHDKDHNGASREQ